MPRAFRVLTCFFLVFFGASLVFAADNRFALVIGNGTYKDKTIPNLSNPVNDATDMAAALKGVGYNVTLKTNIGLREMINVVKDFSTNLMRSPSNEGFFWFAGHGISIKGIHYMLPVDVDPSDDSILARGSFSVDDLMDQIEAARNKTNLIVIDACRNNVVPGSRSIGGRGLAVLSLDDYRIKGNKIVYSTMAGKTAADGVPGSRNSPFARAFLNNLKNPEIFDDVFLDIANETLRLTKGEQEPYSMGTFAVKSYSINPQGVSAPPPAPAAAPPVATPPAATPAAAPPAAAAAPSKAPETTTVTQAKAPSSQGTTEFILDGKKVLSLSIAPLFYGSTFEGKGFGLGAAFTFYEKYRNYGELFFLPNSFYASVDFLSDTHTIKPTLVLTVPLQDGREVFSGGIFGIGSLWKIRLEQSQRFIANFGLSLEFFVGTIELFSDDYDSKNAVSASDASFAPGFGLHGGLSFRFTRLISLDFGLVWKYAFAGKDPTVPVDWVSNVGAYLYTTNEPFAKGIHPYTFSGNLGVTFWWPR